MDCGSWKLRFSLLSGTMSTIDLAFQNPRLDMKDEYFENIRKVEMVMICNDIIEF